MTASGTGTSADFLTSAYRVSTGATLWHVRYDGTPHLADTAVGIAVDPAKSQLYVNGLSENGERDQVVTIAYNSTTGAKKWGKRATEDFEDNVVGLAVDTTNHQVYSLTEPLNTAEIDLHAYTSTGSAAFHTTFGDGVEAQYVAVDSGNDQVYVGGWESTGGSNSQGLVVAFSRGRCRAVGGARHGRDGRGRWWPGRRYSEPPRLPGGERHGRRTGSRRHARFLVGRRLGLAHIASEPEFEFRCRCRRDRCRFLAGAGVRMRGRAAEVGRARRRRDHRLRSVIS